MDRRDFLKTTGAAAVTVGATTAAVAGGDAQAVAAPAVVSGVRELTLASSYGSDAPGEGADRLARRIETATDGRYRIVRVPPGSGDLAYGSADSVAAHRAFGYFAGLPLSQGFYATDQLTWLAIGGGAMLWDELAADFGYKPLIVGHTGASAGVWASTRLESVADLAGARVHVSCIAAEVVRNLGAEPTTYAPLDLRDALADGRLQAAEWLGPLALAVPDLQPLAQRLYQPGFQQGGSLLTLNVRKTLWDAMSNADRAIFEGCAAQEYQLSLTDAAAHALIVARAAAPAKWPIRQAWSPELRGELERVAAEVVWAIADIEPAARRIHDSYQAFRRLLIEPPTA